MGPLVKHPRARDYFKPPEDVDTPPEITVHKLHGHLMKLIDKTKRNKKFDISEFLEFVRKKEEVETVEHLCVWIQGFPLLIQVRYSYSTVCVGGRGVEHLCVRIQSFPLLIQVRYSYSTVCVGGRGVEHLCVRIQSFPLLIQVRYSYSTA